MRDSQLNLILSLAVSVNGLFELRNGLRPPRALEPETWTAPSHTWASVTPVVLDKHPRTDPREDRVGWIEEVAAIVATACGRIGLPSPVEIDVDKTPWHRGAPRSRPGKSGYALVSQ